MRRPGDAWYGFASTTKESGAFPRRRTNKSSSDAAPANGKSEPGDGLRLNLQLEGRENGVPSPPPVRR